METTVAILLRRTKMTETSLILTWMTEEFGKLQTVAKGARRAKSRFAGMLDLFYRCEIQFARSRRSDLHQLQEAVLQQPHEELRFDYKKVELASYLVELLDLVTEPEHPAPELYDLLRRALEYLQAHPARRLAVLHFEKELVRLLGITHQDLSAAVILGRTYHRLPKTRPGLLKSLPE